MEGRGLCLGCKLYRAWQKQIMGVTGRIVGVAGAESGRARCDVGGGFKMAEALTTQEELVRVL